MMLAPWEVGDLEGQGRSRHWGSTVHMALTMSTKFEQQWEFPPVAPSPSQVDTLVPGRRVGFTQMLSSPGDLAGTGFSPLLRPRTWQELTSWLVPTPTLWV